MAKQAQPTTWRPAAPVVESPVITEGDIYAPLKRLAYRYQEKSNKLFDRAYELHKAKSDKADGVMTAANFYLQASHQVSLLVPEFFDEIFDNGSVDAMEVAAQ